MHHSTIKRRDFLKWSGIAGGAALLAPLMLAGCATKKTEPAGESTPEGGEAAEKPVASAAEPGYITDAISDGLPYGADKICPVLCTNGDACGQLHTGQCYVKDGKIVHYEGCTAGHNKGGMCARGMSGLGIINHPDRIKYPMRRVNEKGVEGEFERITWEEAIDEITDAIKKAIQEEGPHTVAAGFAHPGNYASNATASVFVTLFGGDSPNGPECWHDLQFGPTVTLGDMYHCHESDPLESKLLVLWGENTALTKPQEWSRSYGKAMYENGAKLVVIDSRLTETANKADLYLPVRPGTDAYLALAMANVIITEGLADKEFIEKHTFGYDEFEQLALKYTPEEVEKVCWTPADRIREVARLYATMKPAMLCIGRGGNSAGGSTSNAGWMMSRAITCLVGLCGQVGSVGSGVSIETSSGNPGNLFYHWPKSFTMTAPAKGIEPLVERTQGKPAGIWQKNDILYKRDPYGYRVYMTNGNFAATSGNQAEAAEAFKQIDLVVVYNRLAHWTASAFADILLPICSWAEAYVWRPDWAHMTVTAPAIDPLFESVSDIELFKRLSVALGKKLELGKEDREIWPFADDREFIASMCANEKIQAAIDEKVAEGDSSFKEFEHLTFDKALEHPEGVPNPFYAGQEGFVPFKAKVYAYNEQVPEGTDPEEIWFPTDGGTGKLLFKADFLPEQSEGVLPALPVPEEPHDSYYAEGNPIESGNWELSDAVKSGFEYVAVGRVHRFWQFLSFNQTLDGGTASSALREAFKTAAEPCVEINASDAAKLGIVDGDEVVVESQYGKIVGIKAIVNELTMAGTIAPPVHWGNVQSGIYPTSRSLENVDAKLRGSLLPPFVGEFGNDKRRGAGGITNQTGILCKIYKA